MADHMNLPLVVQGTEDAERLAAEHAKDADDCDQQDVHPLRQLNCTRERLDRSRSRLWALGSGLRIPDPEPRIPAPGFRIPQHRHVQPLQQLDVPGIVAKWIESRLDS